MQIREITTAIIIIIIIYMRLSKNRIRKSWHMLIKVWGQALSVKVRISNSSMLRERKRKVQNLKPFKSYRASKF